MRRNLWSLAFVSAVSIFMPISAFAATTLEVGAGLGGLRAQDAAAVVHQQPVIGPEAHTRQVRALPAGRGGEVEQVGADGEQVRGLSGTGHRDGRAAPARGTGAKTGPDTCVQPRTHNPCHRFRP